MWLYEMVNVAIDQPCTSCNAWSGREIRPVYQPPYRMAYQLKGTNEFHCYHCAKAVSVTSHRLVSS